MLTRIRSLSGWSSLASHVGGDGGLRLHLPRGVSLFLVFYGSEWFHHVHWWNLVVSAPGTVAGDWRIVLNLVLLLRFSL